MIKEYMLRGVQYLVSSFVFNIPGLSSIKMAVLRLIFPIGRSVSISYNTIFVSPQTREYAFLKIGNLVDIQHDCFIDYSGGLTIDDHVWISEGVFITTHEHRVSSRRLKKLQPVIYRALHIHEDAWIGAGAIILDKVMHIGRGAIIGAGSVVTHDVEDWAIVAGNPARVISQRSGTT